MSFPTRTAAGALAATLAIGTSAGAVAQPAALPPTFPTSTASPPRSAANASLATAASAASLPTTVSTAARPAVAIPLVAAAASTPLVAAAASTPLVAAADSTPLVPAAASIPLVAAADSTPLIAAAASTASLGTAASAAAGLPPLSPDALSAAIAGLPDAEAGGALVQVRGAAGAWSGSSGISSVRAPRPPALDGRFRIGSMTKVFTAIVTLQLAAERRLDLDVPIQRYLPGLLPASYSPITARQLLTWTSGLNGVDVPAKTPDWYFAHRFDHWTPGSQLDLTKPLAFTPGTQQRYGNVDYIAAGLLIERVTGHSWADEVTRRIIRPLRLTGTSVPGDDIRVPAPHAHGYEATSDGWVDVTLANPSLQWSAASIISTAGDLDRLMVALFRGRLVPQPQLEAMFTVPDVPTYGSTGRAVYSAGLTKFQLGDVTVWAKSGDRPGYNNGMGATRDLSRRLVYSVNTLHMGGLDQPQVAQRIILATF